MWERASPRLGSGFTSFSSSSCLHELSGDELVEVRERALKGDLHAAARLAIDAELERLARMAEAGFPDAPRIFDRFVDVLGQLGRALNLGFLERRYPLES